MRAMLCACVVMCGLGCGSPERRLERATAWLRRGDHAKARRGFARVAAESDARLRVRASLGAAHASAARGDATAYRQWLERATEPPEILGLSEEGLLELAELLRERGETSQALGCYYRAAAAAQRSGRTDLYARALGRIGELGRGP